MVYIAKRVRGRAEQLRVPLAILLTKGERLALAPIYVWSLYPRLNECVSNIASSMGCCDVIMHADTSFLSMFLWERFGALAPKSIEYSATAPRETRGVSNLRGTKNVFSARIFHIGWC